MLGPELLNLSVRPTPIFLEGTAAIRIDDPGPRQLGLTNFQVVQGLVSLERGQLYLSLNGTNHSIYAPEILRRYLGQNVSFRVQIAPDGAAVLRPLPPTAPAIQPQSMAAAGQHSAGTQLSGTPISVLQQLMSPEIMRTLPGPIAAALAGFGVMLNPAMSIEVQTARAREIFARSGMFQFSSVSDAVPREATLPSLLMRLLGVAGDSSIKDRARGLLGEIESRQERAITSLRSDVINADLLAWVNGAPIELNLQRGSKQQAMATPPWIINFYTQFREGSDAWLRVEHHPASTVRLDAWLTDFAVFERARDSRAELVAEVAEFGLRLEHFAVFNQPRDTARSGPPTNPLVRVGESLDRSV
ncbi:MAG: hypothetical protein VW642_12220 [Halieaceae bacterium]|jgi:hypothetical protein